MAHSKTGHIVWHDLFTPNRERSKAFYAHVAHWTYLTEHSKDFAWGGGEKDFVLALSGDEAGAGLIEAAPGQSGGWIPYVEVADVDAAVARANALGGETVRRPFEVPGVGRNALVRDPLGAVFGLSLSRHSFPVPRRQFGPDIYVGNGGEFPEAFYAGLFEWQVGPRQDAACVALLGPLGDPVALQLGATLGTGLTAAWVPNIKVATVSEACRAAEDMGARSAFMGVGESGEALGRILFDTDGALFALGAERASAF